MFLPRSRTIGTVLILCLIMILSTGVPAWADPLDDLKDTFNEALRLVRSDHLLLPLSYIEVKGVSYGYQIPVRLGEMARNGASFRVRKIMAKDNFLLFEMESERGSRIKIRLFDVEQDVGAVLMNEVAPEMLRDLFVFQERSPVPRVVGNKGSLVAHVGVCNHLPDIDLRQEFPDVESSLKSGYRLCPACFPEDAPLPLPRYNVVRQEALESARLFQVAFPPVEDAALQDSVQALGESLVDVLPIDPKGFPYSFRVVQSELMQGTSFPTGFIFVTDKLLAAVENEAELAHILAHEIVHTELHLPPNPQPVEPLMVGLAADWGSYYAHLRWLETEADLLAIGMVGQAIEGADAAESGLQILRKLQFANEMGVLFEGGRFDSHPTYGSRLAAVQNGFVPLDLGRYFEVQNDAGEWIARFKILGAGWDPDGDGLLHVCAFVASEAKEKLQFRKKEFTVLEFEGDTRTSGTVSFGDSGPRSVVWPRGVEIQPGQMGTFVLRLEDTNRENFGTGSPEKKLEYNPAEIDRLDLLLKNGERWLVVEGDW